MTYTDKLLQSKDHRYNAYLAVGLLAMATGVSMQPYLKNVLASIKQALPSKEYPNKRRTPALDPAIFACISMLARAVKDAIKHDMVSMLEAMLSGRTSQDSFSHPDAATLSTSGVSAAVFAAGWVKRGRLGGRFSSG